jgi:hypothetical protein
MSVDSVLSEAWSLYRRFLKEFFLTALVVFVALDALTALVDQASRDSSQGELLFWTVVATVISLVGYFVVQAPLVELVRDVRDGRADRSVGETYRAVQPRIGAVIGAGVIAAVCIGAGLLAFLVPGLVLLTLWALIVPVVVIEGCGPMRSFGRSQEIVRGHLWTMFALMLIAFVGVMGIVANLIRLLFLPLPDFVDVWLGSLVAHSLTVPFAAVVLTTAYFQLTGERAAPAERVEQPLP